MFEALFNEIHKLFHKDRPAFEPKVKSPDQIFKELKETRTHVTDEELEEYKALRAQAACEYIASRFAAKEALAKALGTGFSGFTAHQAVQHRFRLSDGNGISHAFHHIPADLAGIDPDDFPVNVQQRAAGIARIDGGIRLDQCVAAACFAHFQRTV